MNKDDIRSAIKNRVVSPYLFFWARLVLRSRKPCIIGITGSVGKTTTKEMIASVLMHKDAQPIVGSVDKSPGNMNSNIGLPLAVLGYKDWFNSFSEWIAGLCLMPFRSLALATFAAYPKNLVLEYGAGKCGNIHRLARLAPPTVAVVTTIGPAHLETFKTIDRIAHEKGALVRAVDTSGLVVLGQDDSQLSKIEKETNAPVVRLSGRGRDLSRNIARVVGRYFRLPDEVITRALSEFTGVEGRSNLLELGYVMLIDDSFNANPLSMKYGLDTLAEKASPGQRRMAILGVMAELGAESQRYHEEIGAYARARADVLVGVGELARYYGPDHWFGNSEECAHHLEEIIQPRDAVLVKGSHSAELDRVIERIKEAASEQAEEAQPNVRNPSVTHAA